MMIITWVGILLAISGIFTLDWFRIGFGVLIYLTCFAIDIYKKRKVITDDKLATAHHFLMEIIKIIKVSLSKAGVDAISDKSILAQGLFYIGMIDALHQSSEMTDLQFIELQKAIFNDLSFSKKQSARIFIFHKSVQVSHPAYAAIMDGCRFFNKLRAGDNLVESFLAGSSIANFVRDSKFPSSVDHL
ncbi:MAG: hypothetical protein CVV16_09435 [Gammaproteobacteria bacterium HGW-Gammaproteobacteria-6]|nr:MAG: hypothetical protein CVV16_09435 [Gammaproteobacteria bacterium HGW-Gammaproteobacteria-6]